MAFWKRKKKAPARYVAIREWKSGQPESFVLVDAMPPSWDGATVVVLPGCDRRPDTCENVHDNIKNFNGIGKAIPAYNPNFESPE